MKHADGGEPLPTDTRAKMLLSDSIAMVRPVSLTLPIFIVLIFLASVLLVTGWHSPLKLSRGLPSNSIILELDGLERPTLN